MMNFKECGYDYIPSPFKFFDGCLITKKKKVLVMAILNLNYICAHLFQQV